MHREICLVSMAMYESLYRSMHNDTCFTVAKAIIIILLVSRHQVKQKRRRAGGDY